MKPGPGKRDHDGGSTDGVERVTSRARTRSTQPTTDDSVRTATTRAAGRGRDKARSLAAMMCQRRPSDQLTPSHCPQLDGDARERLHVSPCTDNSGGHSVSSGTHTDGSASARPSGNSDSQSRPHKITSVDFVGLTLGLTVRQLR